MTRRPRRALARAAVEPDARPGASEGMSALLRTEGAPPGRAAQRPHQDIRPSPGDAAFDQWLRGELARLYDTTLAEPVPEALLRLVQPGPRE